jgi:tetratricopeptide (TPR) repeat protein
MYGAYGFLWIAAAHAAQYLWITAYYATSADPRQRTVPFLAKAAMAGFAIWTLPALIFAPGLLGRLPHESGLALMVAATVNLHHFVLDGAIWKLRDGRLARILLPKIDAPTDPQDAASIPASRHWLRLALLGIGAASIVYGGVAVVEEEYGFKRALARGDLARARLALERFSWLGREGPSKHRELAIRFAQLGERRPAERELRRSIEIYPTFASWQALGRLNEEAGLPRRAIQAYEAALELQPNDALMLYRTGVLWLRVGEPERAALLLERAEKLAPDHSMIRASLLRARRRASSSQTESDEAGAAITD